MLFLDEMMVSILPSCTEIAPFHSLGKACINWNHSNFIFCDKRNLSFKNSRQWSFTSLSKRCPTKLIPFSEKLEKITHLLAIEIEKLLMMEEKVVKIGIYSIYKFFLFFFFSYLGFFFHEHSRITGLERKG